MLVARMALRMPEGGASNTCNSSGWSGGSGFKQSAYYNHSYLGHPPSQLNSLLWQCCCV
jgi:hypothetical protein